MSILATLQGAQGVILAVAGLIILAIAIVSTIKWGIKSLIFWIIAGIVGYLKISDAILQ